MYDTFDPAHDREHMEGVRKYAIKLAKKYCPDKVEVVYVASTLHDIGLTTGKREDHEKIGYLLIKEDEYIKNNFSREDFNLILEAIEEHRASTGKPKSIVAKIVSDADRAYSDFTMHVKRSYEYNLQRYPELDHNQVLDKVTEYIYPKFKENGSGKRLYFEESKRHMSKKEKELMRACKEKDYKKIDEILNGF